MPKLARCWIPLPSFGSAFYNNIRRTQETNKGSTGDINGANHTPSRWTAYELHPQEHKINLPLGQQNQHQHTEVDSMNWG